MSKTKSKATQIESHPRLAVFATILVLSYKIRGNTSSTVDTLGSVFPTATRINSPILNSNSEYVYHQLIGQLCHRNHDSKQPFMTKFPGICRPDQCSLA